MCVPYAEFICPPCNGRLTTGKRCSSSRSHFLRSLACSAFGWAANFRPRLKREIYGSRLDAAEPSGSKPASQRRRRGGEIFLRHPEVITVVSQHGRPDNGSDASPFSNVELFVPLKPYEQWRVGYTKDMLVEELQHEFNDELPGI